MFRHHDIIKRFSSSSSPLKLPLIPSTTTTSPLRSVYSSSSSDDENDEIVKKLSIPDRLKEIARSNYIDLASAMARNTFFSHKNTPPPKYFCNSILESMCKAGMYRDFFSHYRIFFNHGPESTPDVKSKGLLIRAYCETGCVDDALDVFYDIFAIGNTFFVDTQTYDCLSKALVNSGQIVEAVHLLQKLKEGHCFKHHFAVVYYNVILGYLRVGNLECALQYCHKLRLDCPEDKGIVYANFMDWYLKNGLEEEAMILMRCRIRDHYDIKLTSKMFNAFLECLINHGKTEQVSFVFQSMLNNPRSVVNSTTYKIMVNHYLNLGKISEAQMMINDNSECYWKVSSLNNIIEKFCGNGLVYEAVKLVMKELPNKEVETDFLTYQILIEAYLKEAEAEAKEEKKVHRVDDALELFEKMVFELNLIPRKGFCEKVFDQLINKWGKIDQVANFIEKMGETERDVKPDPTCYEIVMTGLIDAGKLDKVEVLLNQMVNNFTIPTYPDTSKDLPSQRDYRSILD